jgi:phenylpropionate dioxygenase-like ring-hydroxylating dioxygenase large terminal subunit
MPTTLPRHFFTDPAFYERELERFYFGRWICAGRVAQIPEPGDYLTRLVGGESVIVTRDASGGVQALFNVCRHRGTRLCSGTDGRFPERIQCPYHGWTYDLAGRLMGAPHMPPGFRREDHGLRRAGCDVWDGHIFVYLGGFGAVEPPPLGTQLADLPGRFGAWRMADLRLGRRIVYDVKANWKLVILNFNECLHCPTLHPALNRLHHYLGGDNVPPHACYVGGAMGFREGAETMSTDGKLRRAYLPGVEAPDRRKVHYYAIYPNLLLSLHPDYMMTHTLWPRGVDRTEIVCEWHFHPDELAKPGFHADDAVEFWDVTNREDWWVAEQSQAGITSRAYQPGPYSEREALLWAFDAVVRAEAERD